MSKSEEAIQLIRSCFGSNGVWASSARYKNQCWTRDFCLATSHLLMLDGNLKNLDLAEKHLINIADRQGKDGKIPILYLDSEQEFIEDKKKRTQESGKMSFMLQRHLAGQLENLTPHTRDSEVLFIITVDRFLKNHPAVAEKTRKKLKDCSENALKYVETILDKEHHLIPGADWRDTRLDLNDKTVLTNACLLFNAYSILGYILKAENVRKSIRSIFWNGKFFRDYPGCENFDILGNSLVVLYDIADEEQKDRIFKESLLLQTPFGFKMTDTFLPALDQNEKLIMDRDKAVIWPFTNGFLILAMILKGDKFWPDIAEDMISRWEKLKGFYEWYDIKEGNGYGSPNQIWSAALYLRCQEVLKIIKMKNNHLQFI